MCPAIVNVIYSSEKNVCSDLHVQETVAVQVLLSSFMCYIIVVSISVNLERNKLFLIKTVFNLIFVVVL